MRPHAIRAPRPPTAGWLRRRRTQAQPPRAAGPGADGPSTSGRGPDADQSARPSPDPAPPSAAAAAAAAAIAAPPSPFSYVSSDGRRKAVIEDSPALREAVRASGSVGAAGGGTVSASSSSTAAAPWQLGFQVSERTDFLWNDGLKARLIVRAAAAEAGLGEEAMADALRRLAILLPDLVPRLPSLKPALLAALASDLDRVAANLVGLRAALPGADVAALVTAEPRLALEAQPAAVARAADELAALLPPGTDVAGLITAFPAYLDVEGVRAALAEAARVAPGFDLASRIAAGEAAALFRFQARGLLIPYDQFSSDASAGAW
jgi:hypothetical protein